MEKMKLRITNTLTYTNKSLLFKRMRQILKMILACRNKNTILIVLYFEFTNYYLIFKIKNLRIISNILWLLDYENLIEIINSFLYSILSDF